MYLDLKSVPYEYAYRYTPFFSKITDISINFCTK